MFTDGSSDKQDLEDFNVRPMQMAVRKILETVTGAPTDNPVTKLQENETEEWADIDTGVEVTETIRDEKIIGSVTTPGKPKTAEDSEEEDMTVE
jgi:type II secretory pathway component PulC